MPKNWKYIKKLLEKEFLCEKLRGHITYDLTEYKPAPWDQQHFILKCNQDVLLEAQMSIYNGSGRYNLKINPYQIGVMLSHQLHQKLNIENHTCYQDDIDIASYECAEKMFEYIAHYDGIYGVSEIMDDIGIFLHSDIFDSLKSERYFIRALAILDRRCGKRTLEKLAKETCTGLPDWLKRIYLIRFKSENIKYTSAYIA